ncbi:MAG: selenocysteine-specific translation elongation factor [Anaerolineaceae bacterium]|nr:selenocysteine-specific translation elongation factor [Anaerolineaceae bacterium]
MRVIGTAGHVDHGKSTLVKALTGIDPDRLKEEKQRQMTIDLGFAWLTLPSREPIGIVDVPGHQDFIKNMLAGVGGIDAALFVIAADEGVMPQTREHLAILDLLEIPRGIIAMTKVDMVNDEDWLELVEADISETVAHTVLADAPIMRVSALRGEGLPDLLASLDHMLAAAPPRPNRGRPRLPVDRVFSISGFGTIVTGTLLDGELHAGQEVEILPQRLSSRIRGLQSHKKSVVTAEPGSRTAVNLTGLSTDDLSRGSVLTTPGWLEPTQLVDVRLKLLADAPKPLRHNQEVEVFTGAIEVLGHARLLGVRELEPGQEGWVQLRLEQRIPVVKGDHFIIRQPSPSLTIGGGVVVDPLPRRRHRRFRPELIRRLETLLAGTPEDLLLTELDRQGPRPLKALIDAVGVPTTVASTALHHLLESSDVFLLADVDGRTTPAQLGDLTKAKELVASRAGWAALLSRIKATLADYHQRTPLRIGMPRSELKSRLKLETRLLNEALQRGEHEQAIVTTDTTVRLPDHRVTFTAGQQAAIDRLLARFQAEPFNTPLPRDVANTLGDDVMMALVEGGQLTLLSKDVIILNSTYADFVDWLRAYLRDHQTVNVAQVRDAFNTSRKYALALLEYTDDQRLTRRVGDERVLLE